MTYLSLDHELNARGFLSLSKAVKWLKQYHPQAAVSYPTASRLIKKEKLRAMKVGQQHRLTREELNRFVVHGNWEPEYRDDATPEPISLTELMNQNNIQEEENDEDDEDEITL